MQSNFKGGIILRSFFEECVHNIGVIMIYQAVRELIYNRENLSYALISLVLGFIFYFTTIDN